MIFLNQLLVIQLNRTVKFKLQHKMTSDNLNTEAHIKFKLKFFF